VHKQNSLLIELTNAKISRTCSKTQNITMATYSRAGDLATTLYAIKNRCTLARNRFSKISATGVYLLDGSAIYGRW